MFKESIILLALSSSICDILPCWLGSLLGNSSSEDICDVVDYNHLTTCLHLKLDVVVLSIPDLRRNCALQLHDPAGKWV